MAETITKVSINEECISCEACVAVCPDVFEMTDDTCIVKDEAQNPSVLAEQSEAILQAVEECPVEAIICETA